MADTARNPIEAWTKLVESTMKGNPATQTTAEQTQEEQAKDPWIPLIDQLWQANPYSKLLPIDPVEITRVFQRMWLEAFSNPERAWVNYSNFVQQYTQLMMATTLKFWGQGQDVEPIATAEKGDKRFS